MTSYNARNAKAKLMNQILFIFTSTSSPILNCPIISLASLECPISSKASVASPPLCSKSTSSPPGCYILREIVNILNFCENVTHQISCNKNNININIIEE